MNRELVTCGFTAFNAAESIEGAIKSALSQDHSPIEIVVVDDASSDETPDVLSRLANQFPNIRVYRLEKNSGVAAARNRIIAEAKGEFVAFFDDDDQSLPNRVSAQYKRITNYEKQYSNGSPVVCHTARKVIYPKGETLIERTMGQVEGRVAPSGVAVARRILLGTPLKDGYGACPACSQMARLSTYRLLGGFDERYRRGEDTDFNIRLATKGGHFVGIAEPVVIQTMTKTVEKSLPEEHRNILQILEKHRAVIGEVNQYNFCRNWIDAKQAWLEGRKAEFILSMTMLAITHPILSGQRLFLALPNLAINRAYGIFHSN